MEWVLLVAFALAAASMVALPLRAGIEPSAIDRASNAAERMRLLAELRELDDDLAAGRISDDDRQAGRRAIAPQLRAVTELLRDAGDLPVERS